MNIEFAEWYDKNYPLDAFESIAARDEDRLVRLSGWNAALESKGVSMST